MVGDSIGRREVTTELYQKPDDDESLAIRVLASDIDFTSYIRSQRMFTLTFADFGLRRRARCTRTTYEEQGRRF